MLTYAGKVGIQQRVLPAYRHPFFDRLAQACQSGLSVFAGQPRPEEVILQSGDLEVARSVRGRNYHLLHGGAYLCYQAGMLDWLEAWRPDVLVMEANPRYLSTPPAIRWMHRRGRRVIGWGLGAPGSSALGWRGGVLKRFLRRFDGLIAYSRAGAEQYAILGFPLDKIFVAHNAVAPVPQSLPPRARLNGDGACVLYVGRLVPQKRVDLLLGACGALSPQPRLVIVGDGPERGALELLARAKCPHAAFHGAQTGEALRQSYRQADVFVLPGTGGLALQEAMSYGLPLVAGRGDGTQADLVTPANGWILESETEAALAGLLRQALSDQARLQRMGAESFRLAKERFNIDAMADTFVQALRAVTGMG